MRRTLETEECMMSCCEGTRSLHKRYKIALAYKMMLLGGDAADADGEEGSLMACPSRPQTLRATRNVLAMVHDAECSSRVCGRMALGQTDGSSDRDGASRRRDSNDYSAFSISDPTKSDRPRLMAGDCSGINSSNSSNSSSSSISNSWSDRENTSINTIIGPAHGGGQQRSELLLGCRVDVVDETPRKQKVGRVRAEGPWKSAGKAGSSFASMAILALLCQAVGAVLLDTNGPGGEGKAPVQAFGDELGGSNLERSIAAVFSRVAYGSTTTTKRSIPDNVYVPSLTTVSTPLLTTFRYREKDKEPHGGGGGVPAGGSSGNDKDPHYNHQQISANHRNYELDLERDHVLPTSAPNAEILKSNSNPTYPNPNRHHNHDRHRHSNSTPYPHGHNAKKGFPTNSMFSGDVPAYSPPSRTYFTPPLPRNFSNPFADKPTLRGTNSDPTIINTGTYANRRPLPPPSLMPGHERIPMRPPDLVPGAPGSGPGPVPLGGGNGGLPGGSSINPQKPGLSDGGGPLLAPQGGAAGDQGSMVEAQRKKALNTPSDKASKLDAAKGTGGGGYDSNGNKLFLLDENANSSAILPNGMHFPSISRILSGSNGRPQSIPDVLLRSVTSAPRPNQPSFDIGGPGVGPGSSSLNNGKHPGYGGGLAAGGANPGASSGPDGGGSKTDGDGGDLGPDGGAGNSDGDNGRRQFDEDEEEDEEEEEDDPFDDDAPRKGGGTSHSAGTGITSTVSSMHVLSSSSSPITQKMPNLNLKSVMIKNGTGGSGGEDGTGGGGGGADRNFQGEMADISTWTIAWNIHVYLSAILFTILAVYSIFKIIFYDKLTHLFSQSYFISIHLILIIICLLRIFYLCYDAYNIHFSFNLFTSELLLNLPLTFLTTTFAILILFLLLRSINHKTNRYSSILRPLTIIIGSGVHVGLCITLHLVESYETQQFYHKQQQLQLQNKQLMMTAGGVRGGGGGHQHHGGGLPANNIQIPPRVLSLICQIIYIFICLSLGILYLYMYRLLKRILNKSQNYIHGYNNLSYAIHITIATALLFILLAALQIYGAISISSQTKVKLSPSNSLHDGGAAKQTLWASHIEIDWFQWGYQFSLRFIEIVIIALLSWVTGLKTGTSKVIQREKDMEQPNASGFALFPCTSSSSQENFETDYPAVCNTNRNLHTYTMRTGKPIYDDNFALNSLNLEQNSQQDLQLGPPGAGVGPGVIVGGNDFQRSLETNSMRSSSHNYSNNYNGGSSADHNMPDGDDFLNDTETMPDHYENPNFELKHHHHHHHHGGGGGSGSGSASVNHQYHDIMDNCYSEPINAPQYDTKSLRGGHPASMVGPGRNYDFQNFERPNFDPAHPGAPGGGGGVGMGPVPSHSALAAAQSMSRNEFRASKNLKTLKSGQQQMQNDLGGANTMGHHHHYNHHNQMGGGGGGPGAGGNYGDSFDRRIGVRKSGTLNNIGAMHFNQQQQQQHGGGSGRNNNSNSSASSSSNSSNNRAALQQQRGVAPGQHRGGGGPLSGAQTLSSSRSNDHHHHHHHPGHAYPVPQPGSFNDRLLNGTGGVPGADSLERHAHPSQDNMSNNFDDPALGGGGMMVNGAGGPGGAYYHSKKRSRDSSSSSCYTSGGQGGPVPYATGGGGAAGGPDHQATTTTTTATESSSSPTASIGGSNTSGNGTPTTGILPGKLGEVTPGGGPPASGPAGNGSMLVAEQGFVRFRALEEPSLGASQRNATNANVNNKLFMNA
ncbi:uncharacterized protein LOC126574817 isoform X2 [Anopheles aquasalis]|uniref:uncharacterized protein LOC126574817 isoform X2 n=1 Tax=Anopheles aquasalis TaxID=42839 RepID=UPI00215AB773|nr:uncharacterized protein LOC126574817 isoform X2 [Anopheles aquasalis]